MTTMQPANPRPAPVVTDVADLSARACAGGAPSRALRRGVLADPERDRPGARVLEPHQRRASATSA